MTRIFPALLLASLSALLLSPARAADEMALAASRNCLACHKTSDRVIGPSFHSIAEKYRHHPEVTRMLTDRVLHGGSGNFGIVPMPPSPQATPAEARRLVDWILQMR